MVVYGGFFFFFFFFFFVVVVVVGLTNKLQMNVYHFQKRNHTIHTYLTLVFFIIITYFFIDY
jgi:hypothetical protein